MDYLELQSVIKNDAIISEVEERDNRVYFKINNHQFNTFASNVYHEKAPLFKHPISDIWSRKANTAEGIKESEEEGEKINKEIDLFFKHRTSLYLLIFMRAVEIFANTGDRNKFVEYIDKYFDIMENGDNCKHIINLLEQKEGDNI